MKQYYYSNLQHPYISNIISSANEVLDIYLSNSLFNKVDLLNKSKEFFRHLNIYLFGIDLLDNSQKNIYHKVKQMFFNKVKNAPEIKWIEYDLVYQRLKNTKSDISEAGINHTIQFINWILYETEIINTKCQELANRAIKFLEDASFFDRSKVDWYKGRAKLFYRNAYRVEKYAKKQEDGTYDMYVPLILTRMAIEQYIKAYYEEKIGDSNDKTPAVCRQELLNMNYITKTMSNEFYALLRRGNLNTHEGHASYPFATIHGIEVLRDCMKYFDSKNN